MNASVDAEREAFTQGLLRLGRSHRHHDDLTAGRLAQAHRLDHRVAVELVEDERDALALQRLRLLVELDRRGMRDLLDQADDLHSSSVSSPEPFGR